MDKFIMARHEFAKLVNELRAIPNIGSKRELIVKKLKEHGIEPCDGKKDNKE